MINEEKEVMKSKIQDTEDKVNILDQEIQATHERIEDQKALKKQHIQIKVELHQKMNGFKEKFADELQLFYEEEKNKEEVRQLQNKQKVLTADLKASDDAREQVRNQIVTLEKKVNAYEHNYNQIQDQLDRNSQNGFAEIQKMEAYIDKKAIEYDSDTLNTLIDRV